MKLRLSGKKHTMDHHIRENNTLIIESSCWDSSGSTSSILCWVQKSPSTLSGSAGMNKLSETHYSQFSSWQICIDNALLHYLSHFFPLLLTGWASFQNLCSSGCYPLSTVYFVLSLLKCRNRNKCNSCREAN